MKETLINNSFIDSIYMDSFCLVEGEFLKETTLSFCKIKIRHDELLEIRINDGEEICERKIEAIIDESLKLSGNTTLPALIYVGEFVSFTKKALEFSATPDGKKACIAEAFVINNLGHQLLGNIYLKIYRPLKPVALFHSEEKAMKWLKTISSIKNS